MRTMAVAVGWVRRELTISVVRGSRLAALFAFVVAVATWGIAAPAAAALATCNPTINPPGTPAPGTVVAPGLRVISAQWGLGTCPTTVIASSRAADGTIWMTDYANGLWKSTDDLRTIQETYVASGYTHIDRVFPLSSGTLLIVVRDSNGNRHILRSTGLAGTAFASTPVLSLAPGAYVHDSESAVQIGNAVYIGQYQATPAILWKSTDDGQTFSAVWQASDVNEVHAVQADPYVPGRVWMMLDGSSAWYFGYSDNGGQSFTWVSNGVYPQSRVLTLMFDPDAVYWGCDCPDVPGGLYRWDRRTSQVTTVMSNLNGPFYDSVQYNGQLAQFGGVEPPQNEYSGNDSYVHVLTNGNGASWYLTRTPWYQDPNHPDFYAAPFGNTLPDSQGRFWVAYYDLAGTPDQMANLEFQFDPTAKTVGSTANTPTSTTSPVTPTTPTRTPAPTSSPKATVRPASSLKATARGAKVSGTSVLVRITCAGITGETCAIGATLTTSETVRSQSGRNALRNRTVGTATTSLRTGAAVTLRVSLSSKGRRLLRKARRLSVTLTIRNRSQQIRSIRLRLVI